MGERVHKDTQELENAEVTIHQEAHELWNQMGLGWKSSSTTSELCDPGQVI